MPELLCAQGGVCLSFYGLGGGYAGVLWALCVLKGGYEGTFWGSIGGMPKPLWAQGGYAGTLRGLGGVCRNLCGLRGGMPELLGA